jgi:nitroimidazol reductase NimA-like FMN-containing flavoprotein (pyridoxamine 5'-phosphate oxidase superfamily)
MGKYPDIENYKGGRSTNEEVLKFLKDNDVFYLATVDGDKPKVRPFGFVMEHEGQALVLHKQSKKCIQAATGKSISRDMHHVA